VKAEQYQISRARNGFVIAVEDLNYNHEEVVFYTWPEVVTWLGDNELPQLSEDLDTEEVA
jgi:hypothetical protein